jgi:dynein heavy chain
LITTIIKVYINEGALSEGFAFSKSGVYKQPTANTFDQFIEYIEKLPLNPSPEAFGLHDNAQITNSQN